MFKMSATGTNTSTQACWPLVNCIVNQWLRQATPHTADLLQLINVMHSGFVHTLLNAWRGPSFLFPDMQTTLKSINIFQGYDHKCAATFFSVHSVHVLSYMSTVHYYLRWQLDKKPSDREAHIAEMQLCYPPQCNREAAENYTSTTTHHHTSDIWLTATHG